MLTVVPDNLNRCTLWFLFLCILYQAIKDIREHIKIFRVQSQVVSYQRQGIITQESPRAFFDNPYDSFDNELSLPGIGVEQNSNKSLHSLCANILIREIFSEFINDIRLIFFVNQLLQDPNLDVLIIRWLLHPQKEQLKVFLKVNHPVINDQTVNML